MKNDIDRKIICVFVVVGEALGEDRFYIFRMGWLQDYFNDRYKGRKPPHNIKSFHCAIWEKDLKAHLNKWRLIKNKFKV